MFVQASEITAQVGSAAGVLLAWLIAGVLTLLGALVCAELASAFPRTGGVYVFLREIYSPALGFLWGWAMFWIMHSGIVAAIATVFARYAGTFVPMGETGTRVTAVLAILALSAVNYVGTRAGTRVQSGITLAKVAAVGLIIGAGWWLVPSGPPPAEAAAGLAPVTPGGLMLAVSAGLFAFGGWHMVTYTAEETVDAERTIPRALMLGIVVVTLCYIGLNAVYLRVLSVPEVIASSRVAADTFDRLGPGGGNVIAGLVMLSAFGALNGIILLGPRVYYQMAQDGLLFRWAGAVHPRFQTPSRAILLQAIWSSALVWTGTYRALFTRVIYTEWIFFALLGVGILVLRRRSGYNPAWPMPLAPVAPLLFVLASLAIVVNQLRADPAESAVGLALVLSGLPVYWIWARRSAAVQRPGP